jgi:co-chaperonin GroES (HSP10)
MSDNIYPLTTKILLRANEVEKRKETLIVIPDEEKGEYRTATALRVGPDCAHVREGYKIYVDWRKCLDVKIEGINYCFIDEEDVIAIVDKK